MGRSNKSGTDRILAAEDEIARIRRTAVRVRRRGWRSVLKHHAQHENGIGDVVDIVEIQVTCAATGSRGASGEETVQVVDHIGDIERHVIVTVTTNELGLAHWIAGFENAPADAKCWKTDTGAIPGGPAEKPIGSRWRKGSGSQVCTDLSEGGIIRVKNEALSDRIHFKGAAFGKRDLSLRRGHQ